MRLHLWPARALIGVVTIVGMAIPAVAEPIDPAHALAQKFAEPGHATKATPSSPDRPSLDYEMDMLRRARLEAAQNQGPKPDPKPATQPPKPVDKPAAPQPEPKVEKAAAPAPAVETATAIAAEPVAVETIAAEPVLVPMPKPVAEPTAVAETKTAAPEIEAVPVSEPPPAVAEPAATAPTVSPPRAPMATAQAERAALTPPPTVAPTAASPSAAAPATFILVLDRRAGSPPPDAIICLGDACFVSNGLKETAVSLPRAQMMALKTSRDVTFDPCLGKSACVFRGVPVGADDLLQVVDLATPRRPKPGDGFSVSVDASCKVEDGSLDCGHTFATSDFSLWVVPEATAKTAGPAAFEEAIEDGLPESGTAASADK